MTYIVSQMLESIRFYRFKQRIRRVYIRKIRFKCIVSISPGGAEAGGG